MRNGTRSSASCAAIWRGGTTSMYASRHGGTRRFGVSFAICRLGTFLRLIVYLRRQDIHAVAVSLNLLCKVFGRTAGDTARMPATCGTLGGPPPPFCFCGDGTVRAGRATRRLHGWTRWRLGAERRAGVRWRRVPRAPTTASAAALLLPSRSCCYCNILRL